MRKIILLASAFVLTTSAFAMSIPAGRHILAADEAGEAGRAGAQSRFLLASEHGEHGRDHRRHAEEDDEDDDDEGGGASQPRAADPSAPVPDNGLFNGKARPKVEVQ